MSEPRLEVRSDLMEHESAYLALELEISRSYYGFVCDAADDAQRWQAGLFRAANSEFGPPWARVLVADGSLAGIYSAIPGAQLSRLRLLSGIALLRNQRAWGNAMQERLRLVGQTSLQPSASDFYLSRFGIHPAMRGLGLGMWLLERVIAHAAELGLRRCVLEVDRDNAVAIRLYERAGFIPLSEHSVADPASRRRWERLSMSRSVSSAESGDIPSE